MQSTPSVLEGSTKRESVKGKEGFPEDLNRILSELFGLCLDQNKARRVQEKREANKRFNLKKRELESFIREAMKSPGMAIKVYDKLSRLLTRVVKHGPSVQYLILNGIVEKVGDYKEAN